jgi:hypothetical protein
MKKIFLLSAVIAISFSCNEKKQEASKNTDTLADNLKGNVRQVVGTDYKVDSTGKIGEQDSCCVVTSQYDEKGYLAEYTSVDKSGANVEKETFSRYDEGSMKDIKMSKNDKPTGSISVELGKDGKYATAKEFDSAGKMSFYYTDISQNDFGQLTGMKKFKPDSTLSGTSSMAFDSSIFKSSEMKDSSGKVTFTSAMTLDDKNNVVENATMDASKDSATHTVTRYKYDSFDDQGNWTQRTQTDGNNKPVKITKREITYYKK